MTSTPAAARAFLDAEVGEARPEPYDITDASPNVGNPETMFVPFFWLDTVDGVSGTSNSYFTDSVGNISGATMSTNMTGTTTTQQGREAAMFNVFKYRNNARRRTRARVRCDWHRYRFASSDAVS